MDINNNPLIQPEDFLAGYRQKVEALKNNPALFEFDRLCYELFKMNEQGKRFMEIVYERYLIPSLANRDSANYAYMTIWADGFKDAFRMIVQAINSHDQRIKHEDKR